MFLRFFRFGVSANFGIADNSLEIRPVTLGRGGGDDTTPNILVVRSGRSRACASPLCLTSTAI
jgi:hypothetical protein